MKTAWRSLLFTTLGAAMASFVFGEEPDAHIHFAGYVTESNFTLFSLKVANGDRTTAKWAEIADSFSGYILKSFDPKTEELVLSRGDELMKLTPEIRQIRKTVFVEGKIRKRENQKKEIRKRGQALSFVANLQFQSDSVLFALAGRRPGGSVPITIWPGPFHFLQNAVSLEREQKRLLLTLPTAK